MGIFGDLTMTGVPEHFYKAMCQDQKCRAPLGGMHIPCTAGMVVFFCRKCGGVTMFEATPIGFKSRFLGVPKNAK
jgi:hypothetical protein